MVQGNIDEYDLKGDVVAMEKRMYVPTYLKTAPKKPPGSYSEEADTEGEKRVEDTFRLNPKSETKRLEYHPERKPLKWIEVKQMAKDGVIGLGKGAVGPELKHRVKIVQKKGEGEHPDIALDEVACDDVFANPIQLRMDYLESEHPQSKYLTRKDFDAGEKVSSTLLNAETFQKIWGHAGDMPWDKKERDNIPPSKRPKDEHKPWDCAHTLLKRTLHPPLKEATSVFGDPKYVPAERTFADAQAAKVKMRHKPDFIWCCMWVVDDEGRKEHKLHNSEVLGPSKGDYVQAMAPPFHPSDKPNDDPNDEPRRYGRICRWEQEPGTDIKPGDDLIAFRVYSNKLVHAKRNPNGRFPNTLIQTKEEKEKYAKMDVKEKELFDLKAKEIEEEMKMFDGEWIDDIEGNALSLMWDEVASGMDAAKKKTQIKEVTKNGTEIKNADLALALTKKLEFTKEELDKFKVKNEHLACDEDGGPSCYIKTGDGKRYFKPAANLGEILERWKPENEDDDIAQTDRAKIEHPKLLLFKSKGQGELTGLIRDVGSKICSFDELAFLDPKGEVDPKTKTHAHDGWEQMILPVAEWPAQFYS